MKASLTKQIRFSMMVALMLAATIQLPARAVRNMDIGDSLPDFALPRADGTPGIYRSGQLAGQPAVIIFWRPNHDLSLAALRDLQAVAQAIGVSRFRVLAVDAQRSSLPEVRTSLEDEVISFPVVLDPQRFLYEKVGLIVCPTALLFDAKGVLRFVAVSHPRQFRQVVEARLRFLLGDIDQETMEEQIRPTVHEIPADLAAAWRMYNFGRTLEAENKPAEAVSAYEKAIGHYPALVEAHCALGFLSLAAGQLQVAGGHFQDALSHRADSPVGRLGQAAVLARTGRIQEAEDILLTLLKEESKSIAIRVRYELGRLSYRRQEYEKAAVYYQDALAFIFSEPGPAGLEATTAH